MYHIIYKATFKAHLIKETGMKHFMIEVQPATWMSCEGVETSVSGGNTDEPQIETTETYETLIDKQLESYIFDGKIAALHHDETAAFIAKLKSMYEYAEQQAKLLGWKESKNEEGEINEY